MEIIKGIPVSPGVVIGTVFVLDDEHLRIPRRTILPEAVATEVARLERALDRSVGELSILRGKTEQEMGEEAAKIFAFHIGMLCDPALTRPMRAMVEKERVTAEFAAWRSLQDLGRKFSQIPDPTFRTKVDDVKDLSARVLKHLIGEHSSRLNTLDHRAVVVAKDLTPSQAAAFDRKHVIAFATDLGGQTSHTAIFARALGIPAVVGCGRLTEHVDDGMPVIIDGDRGVVILDPTPEQIETYRGYIEQQRLYRLSLADLSSLPSETRDGVHVELLANIEFPEEIPIVLECGGEGVGLYRTEYLFLTSDKEPTEEDHYNAYAKAVELLRLPGGEG